jgi:hypothetical protein
MEGGASLLTDPSLIERRYREAVTNYFKEIDEIMNHSIIDYHRILMNEPYEQALARFLMGRNPKTARTAR